MTETTFQPLAYEGPTREKFPEEVLGLPGGRAAEAAFAAITAGERAKARADHALAAAGHAVRYVCDHPNCDPELHAELAGLLLVGALQGVGGIAGLEGCGTDRPRWAEGCGTGRRNAMDGGAWDAAFRGALEKLLDTAREGGPIELYWDHDDFVPGEGSLELPPTYYWERIRKVLGDLHSRALAVRIAMSLAGYPDPFGSGQLLTRAVLGEHGFRGWTRGLRVLGGAEADEETPMRFEGGSVVRRRP